MTDEQLELAEYVAIWAGWELTEDDDVKRWLRDSKGSPTSVLEYRPLHTFLTDDALAFRAFLELVELQGGDRHAWVRAARMVSSQFPAAPDMGRPGPTHHEAIFRAHRSVMEGR